MHEIRAPLPTLQFDHRSGGSPAIAPAGPASWVCMPVEVLLGHAELDTTALYARVATTTIQQVMSPLEHIALKLKEVRPPA
jgi:hypothetical protein